MPSGKGLDKADLFGSIHATGYGRGQRHRDAFYYPGIDSIRDWSLSAVVYPVHSSRQVFCIFLLSRCVLLIIFSCRCTAPVAGVQLFTKRLQFIGALGPQHHAVHDGIVLPDVGMFLGPLTRVTGTALPVADRAFHRLALTCATLTGSSSYAHLHFLYQTLKSSHSSLSSMGSFI